MQNTKATTVVSTQTKKIESVQVSIINAADSINEGEASNFSLELRNNSDELVVACEDVAVNVVCTGTAENGDEYIGSAVVIIACGSSKTEYDAFAEKYLQAKDIGNIGIALKDIKESGFENISINNSRNFAEVDIIDNLQACLSVAEVTVDGVAGVAEFTIVLSGAALTQEASVDYIIGDITAKEAKDYQIDSGTLIFGPGITTHTVTIPITGEEYHQNNGVFNVVLANPVHAKIIEGSGLSSLTDEYYQNSTSAFVSIVDSHTGRFGIQLRDAKGKFNTAKTDVVTDIHFSGTTMNSTDFVGVAKMVLPANSCSMDFDIEALDECIGEASDSITVKLNHVTGGGFKAISIDHTKSGIQKSVLAAY